MSAEGIPTPLSDTLLRASTVNRLLLASDYDGCIAPIVSRPQDAVGLPESIEALRAAARLDRTTVAVVSGRALSDLAALSGLADDPITLVGSHGSEFDTGFGQPVTAEQQQLLARIIDEFESIATEFDGVTVEVKPVSTTLHVRNASPADAATALDRARLGPARWDGVEATEGKAVIELAVIETSKGLALDLLRDRTGADVVIYLGDDVTDEKAFAHLRHDHDISIKVGPGDTAAQYRVGDPADVAAVLEFVAAHRREALG
ncbi:MAG TPA: trehalose-phosphatase [Gordonia polyisoprenivorans]|uniref:trehalose-phosphatase n=1 Tax=Gordonia polyisoprenivorans TaxID=84595 RepID=UPI000369DB5E|nr:trehalose-phosphatase [Gordonia polyisoprenivorans]QUD81863.1 trehalose-phosphatase [Gordonia polyisoprenivorans]HCS58693.1 trehalose-phosphatase [Gordonia polyisoprenivorans]